MREVNADNAGMGSEAAVQVVQACCLHCQQVRDYQPTAARLTLFTNTSMVLEYFCGWPISGSLWPRTGPAVTSSAQLNECALGGATTHLMRRDENELR